MKSAEKKISLNGIKLSHVDGMIKSDTQATLNQKTLFNKFAKHFTKKSIFSEIYLLSLLVIALSGRVSAQNYPGTGASVVLGATVWTTPTNISADDNAYASSAMAGSGTSYYLKATNFGFSIPVGSTINGITVTIGRYGSLAGVRDVEVKLINGSGSAVGDNKAVLATNWPTSETALAYGGVTDTWNALLAVSDINDVDFGVQLAVRNNNAAARTAFVDYITITVSYTAPGSYCTPSAQTLDGITGVVFNTINNTGTGYNGYTNYTATQSTTVTIGSSYSLSVYVNDGSSTNSQKVWIDWNQDGSFNTTAGSGGGMGEEYDLGTVTTGLSSLCPLSITVPAGATIGTTRMRVSSKWNGYATSCATGIDGEFEDYAIVVQAACTAPTGGSISGTTPVCTGTSGVTYTYSGGTPVADAWSWSAPAGASITAGAGTSSITVTFGSTSGNVSCTPSVSGCADAAVLKAVTVNALPTPSFTAQPGASACVGSDVTYTTQAGMTNYLWTVPGVLNTDYSITSGGVGTGSNTVTLKWLTTGSKTVTINYTNSNSCTATSATSSTATTVSALPTVAAIAGGAATVCVNATTAAFTDASAGGTWSITAGTGTASITAGGIVTGLTAGTVTVAYTVTSGGCSNTATTSLNVNALPTVAAIGGGAATVCISATTPAFTDATAGGTWSINPGTGTASITVGGVATGLTAGTTTVVYTVTGGGCSNTATTALTVNSSPAITGQPGNQSVSGGAATFTVTATGGGLTYQWQEYAGSSWSNVSNSAPYSGVTTATLTITNPTVGMTGYKYRCVVSGCAPSATSNGNATLTVTYCTPTATNSTYYITGFSTTGGVSNITNTGTTSGITSMGYSNYTANSVSQYANSSINFSVSTFNGTYTYGIAIWVDWNNNDTFESGEKMYTSGGWVSNPSGSFTVPTAALVGSYRMRVLADFDVISPSACTFGSSHGEAEDYTFNVIATPAPTITSLSSGSGCAGSSLTINGINLTGATAANVTIGGMAVNSITSNNGSVMVVVIGSGTSGTVSVTTLGGTATSGTSFTVNPLPTATASSNAVCAGATLNLTGTTDIGTSFSWTGPNSFTSTSQNPSIPSATSAASGTYSFTATANGCNSSASAISITVNPLPTAVTAAASNNFICPGSSIDLTSTATSNASSLVNFSEGFETFPPTGWTFINAGSGNSWASNIKVHSGAKSMSYNFSAAQAANAWGITSGSILTAGTAYIITFWYETDSINFYPEKLKVTVGNLPTVAGQTTTLWDCNGAATLTNQTWAQGYASYTPTISGTYYFGFNCYSDANKRTLYLDDVSITGGSALPATFAWTSTPAGYTSSAQNPTGVSPTVNTQYTVTAQNSYGCTASNSTTVNIMNTLPQCATYTSPANGAPNAGLGSSLTWTAPGSGGTPTGYKLYFGTDNPPTNMINGTNIGNVLTYSPTLTPNTTYYWKVVPTNCAGDASCSDIWSFHTATPTIVTVGPSADFPTIRAAYDACTLASPYIIEVQPPYAGETYPILFGSANAGQRSANNIIIIRPAAGASWNFTTGTVNSLFEFNGAKWVVIDGRKGGTGASGITMENTQTASGNWAISMHGGSTNNTIKYCTIKGSNADATPASANAGVIRFADGTNSNNIIDNCTITPSGSNKPAVGILSYDGTNNNLLTITNNSFVDITRYGIWASGSYNTGWTISNNKFYQSGAIVPTPAGVMAAIQIDNGGGYTISGNNIGGQAGGSSPYTVTGIGSSGFVGINFANSTASSTNTITSNTINDITINLSAANTATPFCFTGMNATGSANFTIGSSGNGNTIGDMTGTTHKIAIVSTQSITNGFSAINNTATGTTNVAYNNVGSIDLSGISTACSNNVNMIRSSNASGTISIDHNTIGNTVTDNMNMGVQAASLVYNQASVASATFAATNNTIQNIKYTGSGAFYGIYNNQCAMTCTGNNISGINSTGTSYLNCIYHSAAYTANISNNNINTITATNAGSQSKIIYLSSGTAASTISDNTIGTTSVNNISLAGNTIQCTIDITNGGIITCDHNVIQNITLTSTGSNNIFFGLNVGPSSESKGTPGTAVLNATNNTIQDITTSSTSNHYNESFAGLRLYSSGSGHTISNNVIQRLNGIGTGAGSCEVNAVSIRGGSNGAFTKNIISDITVSHAYANMHAICYDEVSTFGGTWNFYNNAIILNNSTNGYVEGLHFYGTGVNNTVTFYHNTVKISGTTIANVSSVAFGIDVTQGTYTIENNVFQNLRTGGTANYAIENLDSYAITEKNDYLQGSDPTKIGHYGNDLSSDKTFAAWNTAVGSIGNINGNTTPVSLDAIGKPPVGAPLQNAGTFLLATVPDDRLSASRAIAPYPGAYELTATLPVELIDFRAVCKNTNVLITWSTATETNNDNFTIEYSTDAKNWQAIATVKGANNSNQILHYSTIHENINNGGISYYRLKQTNFDGEYEYFAPVVVSCNSENQYKINVYPNPFNQHLNIDINGLTTEKANIQIMDLTGKTVFSQSLNNNDNTFQIDLDVNLPNGVYFMKLQIDSSTQNFKIVKCMN